MGISPSFSRSGISAESQFAIWAKRSSGSAMPPHTVVGPSSYGATLPHPVGASGPYLTAIHEVMRNRHGGRVRWMRCRGERLRLYGHHLSGHGPPLRRAHPACRCPAGRVTDPLARCAPATRNVTADAPDPPP